MQKLVFLCLQDEKTEFYDFLPYHYGPYSFQLASDIEILQKQGHLLKGGGIQLKNNSPATWSLNQLSASTRLERGDKLIRQVYREHPYYAINSRILERIFHDDSAGKQAVEKAKSSCSSSSSQLFTIGYEGQSVEAFFNRLIKNDIRVLCDVRRNPISRKFGFSKSKLKHIADQVKIHYVHIPELGIESQRRSALRTTEDYQYLFEEYRRKLTSCAKQLESLQEYLASRVRVALMCFEREPGMCHRHVLASQLFETYGISCTEAGSRKADSWAR